MKKLQVSRHTNIDREHIAMILFMIYYYIIIYYTIYVLLRLKTQCTTTNQMYEQY